MEENYRVSNFRQNQYRLYFTNMKRGGILNTYI